MKSTSAPTEAIYDENGVDLTLIRWMLSLSVAERIEYIQDLVASLEEIRQLNPIDESGKDN